MSDYNNTQGFELDWESEIENDGPEYITLPEGDYDFTVVSFERQRYSPGPKAKLPPCNMAVLKLQVEAPEGTATFQHRLYLHSSVEGLLCAFFTCIGQRRHGERITMNWGAVTGARGRAHIGIRKYTNDKGEARTINEIAKFLEPADDWTSGADAAPSAPPAPAATGYQAGKF